MIGERVTVIEPGAATDRYGASVDDWDVVVETIVRGVRVAPGPVTELTDEGRDGSKVEHTLYLPADATAPTAKARVEVRGDTFRVAGEPAEWRRSGSGLPVGIIVELVKVDG